MYHRRRYGRVGKVQFVYRYVWPEPAIVFIHFTFAVISPMMTVSKFRIYYTALKRLNFLTGNTELANASGSVCVYAYKCVMVTGQSLGLP